MASINLGYPNYSNCCLVSGKLIVDENDLTKFELTGVELPCLNLLDLSTKRLYLGKNRLEAIELAKAKVPQLRVIHLTERNRVSLINLEGVVMETVEIMYFERCGLTKIDKFDKSSLPKLR